jgi:hypothetical protein
MIKAQIYLYNNRFTGEVLPLTKQQGKKLSEDWSRIKPVINEKGQRVLRMKMQGATIDILETEVANVVPGSK